MAFGGFRSAGLEMKNITGSGVMKGVLVALAVIPCLCAAFYLASFSDPYKALDAVPVAIVNQDEGATINGEERNVGEEVCNDISARTDGLQWNFVSSDEASAGMEAGDYYMVCTIPSDFSERIASADTGEPKAATLGVEYDESQSAAASQMGRSVWQKIQGQISDSITRQYWNTMLTRASDAGKAMEESAAGAQQLADGMGAIEEGNSAISEGIAGLGQGAATLQSGLGAMATGGEALGQGATALASTGSLLDAGVQALAAGTKTFAQQTSGLGEQTQALADGAQAIDEGLQATVAGIGSSEDAFDPANPTLASSSQAVGALVTAAGDGLDGVASGLAAMEDNAIAALKDGLGSTKGALDKAASDLRGIAQDAEASEGSQQMDGQLTAAQGSADAAATDAATAQDDVSTAQASVKSAQAGLADTQAQLESLMMSDTLSEEDAAAVSAALDSLSGSDTSLDNAVATLASAVGALDSAAANAQGASSAIAGVTAVAPSGVSSQVEAVAQSLEDLSSQTVGDAGDAALDGASGSDAKKTLYAATNGIAKGTDSAQMQVGLLSRSNETLAAASDGMTQGIDALGQGLSLTQQGASALSTGASAFAGAMPLLSQGAQQLDQGTQGVATGVSAYVGGASVIMQSIPAFVQGIAGVAEGTSALVSGSDALASASGQMGEGMTMVAEGNQSIADQLTDDSDGLRMPKAEIEDKADMMSAPVELNESYLTHVQSYAAGVAPNFLAIALWIGCLAASFVLRPFDKRLAASGANPFAAALSGFLPMAALAIVQSLVLMLTLQFVMGMQVDNVPQFYAFGLLIAVAFAAIMQLLSAAFGFAGRLAAVVLLMLQIACVSGAFPIEAAAGLFQALDSIMPMTFAVDGMRQIMTGVGFNVAAGCALALAVVLAAGLALTSLAVWRKRMVRMSVVHPALRLG